MKECKTCKQKKSKDCYSKDRQNRDGLFTECKECYKVRLAKRYAEIKKRKEFEIF